MFIQRKLNLVPLMMQFIWAQWQNQIEVNWNRQWPFKREIECWAVGGIDMFWCRYCVSFRVLSEPAAFASHTAGHGFILSENIAIDVLNYFQHLILDFFHLLWHL